eukprot:COSAG06_NODE_19076_length_854_cov_2.870199_1_plen_21_part_10
MGEVENRGVFRSVGGGCRRLL